MSSSRKFAFGNWSVGVGFDGEMCLCPAKTAVNPMPPSFDDLSVVKFYDEEVRHALGFNPQSLSSGVCEEPVAKAAWLKALERAATARDRKTGEGIARTLGWLP